MHTHIYTCIYSFVLFPLCGRRVVVQDRPNAYLLGLCGAKGGMYAQTAGCVRFDRFSKTWKSANVAPRCKNEYGRNF